MSRRKSSRFERDDSHSALFSIRPRSSEERSKKRLSWVRMAAAFFRLSFGGEQSAFGSVLPLGSPISPVPPPMRTSGRWPWRCACARAITGNQAAEVQAVGGGVEADVDGSPCGVQEFVQVIAGRGFEETAPAEFLEKGALGLGQSAC